VTGYGYDAAGRQIQTTNPATGTMQTAYDAAGNTLAMTTTDRTNGNAVIALQTMGYDALNRVITSTVVTNTANVAGSALTTLTAYDQNGNVAQTQQPNGDVVYNLYDAADRVTNVEIDPAPLTKAQAATHPSYEAYGYDAAGNQTVSVDADNRMATTQYDGDNRMVQSVAMSAPPTGTTTITTTMGYDPNGNSVAQTMRTSDSTSPGVTQTHAITSAYNAADWETSTSNDGLTTSYTYDAAGQQIGTTTSDGLTGLTTGYDSAGRVASITENAGGAGPYTTAYTYTPDDLPKTLAYPNSVNVALGYDANSQLTSLSANGPPNQVPATTTLASGYAYGYNAAGWITSTTTLSGTDTITHDASGRLTDECGPQMVTPDHCGHWTYDKNGNLLTAIGDAGVTDVYSYTNSVQPNEQTAGGSSTSPITAAIAVGYDANGDTTSISNPVALTDPTSAGYKKYALNESFGYDAQQRPITVTRLESTKVGTATIVTPLTATLQYNADGLRADYLLTPDPRTGKAPVDTRFAYRDGALASATVTDITGTLLYKNTFIYGPSGEPLELIRTDPLGTHRYWYVLDGLGSVVALTDQNGKVVDRYAYDAWGETITDDRVNETVPQQLRYRSYYYDEALTYYWVTTRYYDPEGMRWFQPDPSDLNGVRTYAYVGDDPIDYDDPAGLDFWSDTFGCNHWYDQFIIYKTAYCTAYQEYKDFNTLRDPHTSGLEKALIVVSYIPLPGDAVATRGARVVFAVLKGGRAVDIALRRGRYITVEDKGVRAFLHAVGGCACFPAGTSVATPHGPQAIQTLQVGDLVQAEDPKTGKVEAEAVQAVIDDGMKPLMALALSDGEAITVTVDHPFYVDSGLFLRGSGWLQAVQLQPGDRLRTADGRDAVVVRLRRGVGRAEVYTLTVAHDHTFFVGAARVLVHNADCGLW